MVINPEGAKAVDSKGTSVRFQLGYDPTSTEGVLKAVKSKEGHTISLDGNEISCPDSKKSCCIVFSKHFITAIWVNSDI